MNLKRKDEHTYEEYRRALKVVDKVIKQKLKGVLIWDSRSRGTYRRGMAI